MGIGYRESLHYQSHKGRLWATPNEGPGSHVLIFHPPAAPGGDGPVRSAPQSWRYSDVRVTNAEERHGRVCDCDGQTSARGVGR